MKIGEQPSMPHPHSLIPNAYARLPIGSVRARGWLREQLRLSAAGLTGQLMDVWDDVGSDSGWLGGQGENWERGPYYARGLTALAYTLDDAALIARARKWIDWSLSSQRADGFFGPPGNDDWWPRMPMLEAVRLYYEATADQRVLRFMTRYLRFQLAELPSRPLEFWGKPRGGDNLDSALWLYRHTADPALLQLADLIHAQSSDWVGELTGDGLPNEEFDFGHGVNRAMGMKEPVVYFQRSGDPRHHDALRHGWERTLAYHGQIQGTFSGDEFLHGRGSTQGTELCTVVELLSTFETALRIGGEPWIADAMERIAYNALPAFLTPDHRGHQYFQLPNQVECTPGNRNFHVAHGTDLLFGLVPGYGCCAANYHIGWPLFVNHLWMATADCGLAALLLAPSQVTARIAGHEVTIIEDTTYPFDGTVCFTALAPEAMRFPLHIRIPGWAERVDLTVNGVALSAEEAGGIARDGRPAVIRLDREWCDRDTIIVQLRMPLRLSRWERGSIGIERGPLVYALRIGEEWRAIGGHAPFSDYEVHPTTPWNYGLRIDAAALDRDVGVIQRGTAEQPWAQDGAPTTLVAPARQIPEWVANGGVSGPIPEPGSSPATPVQSVTLIPFGCARLRIAMFPSVT